MSKFFIGIYDWFALRKAAFWLTLAVTVGAMAFLASRVKYDERITSFFPDGGGSSLVFENMKMKDRIVVMFSASGDSPEGGPDRLIECGEEFREVLLGAIDPAYVQSVLFAADDREIEGVTDYIYENLPLFLTDGDYARTDSLLRAPGALAERMEYNRNLILSPAGIGVRDVVMRDPLGMGGETLARLQELAVVTGYEIYDDHIFSPGLGTMLMVITPSYGIGDTGSNEKLIKGIEAAISRTVEAGFSDVSVEYMGGPTYAVGNARQLKRDTVLTLTLALSVIITFILLAFRNRWAVLLIITPAIFGGLFALALISLIGDGGISAIAVGAGAAVFGIALSYSIHVVSHNNHTHDPREVIKELAYPLTVGGFTTIGAFAGLMFTQSQLLRDFGLFSSLMLAGTTLYCLIFLPHFLKHSPDKPPGRFLRTIERITDYPYDRKKWLVAGIAALVIVCVFFFNKVKFDSDMMNLNYASPELRAAEEKLQGIFGSDVPVTIASVGGDPESAFRAYGDTNRRLDSLAAEGVIKGYSSAETFLIPPSEQRRRIEKWNSFWAGERREAAIAGVDEGAARAGFNAGAFGRFADLLEREYRPEEDSGELPSAFDGWAAASDGFAMYLTQVNLDPERKAEVYTLFIDDPGVVIVDRGYFANTMAKAVNDDFSLILYFSSLLIFGALLLSYGRIELALMAFLPMFLSWIIILGLMAIFGIEFNIVNIILSTFIFGIGDDFSIFIMDGLLSEYRNGKKLLREHKTAIFFSAVTTVVGVGVLMFAKHPALRSMAMISIFGIVAVVLVSFTVQPVIFRMFISSQTRRGGFPYTLMGLLNTIYAFLYFIVGCALLHVAALVLLILPAARDRKKLWFHACICGFTRFFLKTMFTTRRVAVNEHGERFGKPSVIIANHQSFIDILVMLSLHPKLLMVTKSWVWNSPFFGWIVRYAGFYNTSADGYEKLAATLRPKVEQGYSVVVFPEGTRSADNRVKRFHKGAFLLAEELNLDILPIVLYGNGLVSSKTQPFYIKKGLLVSKILERIPPGDSRFGTNYGERAKLIGAWFRERYGEAEEEFGRTRNPYFYDALIKNYIYKGPVTEWYMRVKVRMERSYRIFDELIPRDASVVDIGCGYGGLAYMLALLSPRREILGVDYDGDKIALAEHNFSRTERIRFACADATEYDYPRADVFVMNDVLHYMDYPSQEALLERCFGLVGQGGMVIVRDGDSSQKERQKVTERTEKWSTEIIGFNKTAGALCFTSTERISALARRHGFEVRTVRNDGRTSNMIHIITRAGER